MPIALRRQLAVALLATLALPAAALAQDAASCSVDLFKPNQLAQATILIQRAAENPEGEAASEALRDAMRLLQDDRRFASNPNGLAFARAQIYLLWLHQDEPKAQMSPYELNAGRDRNTMIDLAHAADSLLTMVEEANPSCTGDIDRWRQSKPWNDRISAAYNFLEANQLDSAKHYADAAYQLDRRSPFIYNAYAQIAARRGDGAEMRKQLETAIELADKDTALVETTRQLRTQYAASLQEAAMAETDPATRATMLKRAGQTFLRIGQEDPAGENGPAFISAALDIAMLIQDTVLLRETLAPMLEDPTPYQDLALLLGAETTRLLGRPADAMTLYRSALAKNPYIRDANYFLAFLLIEEKKAEEALPLVEKLLELDPSNPDNITMKVLALRQQAEAERDATKKAALIREIEALTRREAQMQQQQTLRILRFERRAEGGVLGGEIENRSRTAKTFTLEVEFLDVDGNVVETQSVTTASAPPNGTVPFEVTATLPGIAAYRYKPLA